MAVVVTAGIAINRVGAGAFAYVVLAQSLTLWPVILEKGVGFSLIRLVSIDADDTRARSLLGSALVAYLGLAAVTLLFGLLASRLLTVPALGFPAESHSAGIRAFELLVIAATLRNGSGFLQRGLLAKGRLFPLRSVELLRDLVPMVATLLLVGNGPDEVIWVAAAILMGDVAATCVGLVWVPPSRLGMRLRNASWRALGEHVHASRPLVATGFINLLSTRIDVLVVSVALGPSATSAYGLIARLVEPLLGAMTLLSLAVTPTATRMLSRRANHSVANLFRRASGYSALLCWPIGAAIALPGAAFIADAVHADLPNFIPAMVVAMSLTVPQAIGLPGNAVIIAADRVGEMLRPTTVGVMLNVAASVALVTVLGVTAVFVGTFIEGLVMAWWTLHAVGQVTGSRWTDLLDGLLRPCLLTAGAVVLLGLVALAQTGRVTALGLVAVVGACYLAGALIWAVPREDLRQVLNR